MDSVKFVPPGGHRACLSCSAAKAKCVFPDESNVGLGPARDAPSMGVFSVSTGPNVGSSPLPGAGPSAAFGGGGPSSSGISFIAQSPMPDAMSTDGNDYSAPPIEGVAAFPRCERCDRLGRDCLLPVRPRKKRRVGPIKPGTSRTTPSAAREVTLPLGTGFATATSATPTTATTGAGAAAPTPVAGPSSAQRANIADTTYAALVPNYVGAPAGLPAANLPNRLANTPTPPSAQSLKRPPGNSPRQLLAQAAQTASAAQVARASQSPKATTPVADAGASNNSSSNRPSRPPAASPGSAVDRYQAARQLVKECLRMEHRPAEEILRFYRDMFSEFNNFMDVVSPGVSAESLQRNKPSVWLAIVFATSYDDFEHQNKLARAIIIYFSEQVFHSGQRTLELLQGILIFLNWFGTQNYLIPQHTSLSHMAIALVTDLGLDRLEFSRTADLSPLEAYASGSIHGHSLRAAEQGHTLDERRALVGCFCLSHAVSAGVTPMSPLQYTMQLEDTCRYFESKHQAMERRQKSQAQDQAQNRDSQGKEFPSSDPGSPTALSTTTDLGLAVTVRLYYLIYRVLQTQREAEFRGGRYLTPVPVLITQFLADLDQICQVLTIEMRTDINIKLLYHTTQMHIYKFGLAAIAAQDRSRSGTHSSDASSDFDTSDIPVRCFEATAAFFETFFTLPIASYFRLTMMIFTQIVHADITLAMLTAYYRGNTHPAGLTPGVILPVFDDVMEALASRFQKASRLPHPLGRQMRNSAYDAFAARFRSFKFLGLNGRRKAPSGKSNASGAEAKQSSDSPQTGADSMPNINRGLDNDTDMDRTDDVSVADSVGSHMTDVMDSEEGQDGNEWWAWFQDFQKTMLPKSNRAAAGQSSLAGSVAGGGGGGSVVGTSVAGASVGGASVGDSIAGTERMRRGGSVGSIDSLLNNNDEEPNFYAYIQEQHPSRRGH